MLNYYKYEPTATHGHVFIGSSDSDLFELQHSGSEGVEVGVLLVLDLVEVVDQGNSARESIIFI